MVAVKTTARFDHRCRRHKRLELVDGRIVRCPGRRICRVRIAARGEAGPVADNGLGESDSCPGREKSLGVPKTSKRYGTLEKCGAPSRNKTVMPGKRSKMR
jgi:hypothetical protein